MGYAKLSPVRIIELIYGSVIDVDVTPTRPDNTGDQVQQGGFPGSAGADDGQLFMLINRKRGDMQKEISGGIRKL